MPYDNTNRGVLFENTRKTNPKHSDYQGELDVDGTKYWLNAWVNKSKNGVEYLSVSIKPKTGGRFSEKKPEIADNIPF